MPVRKMLEVICKLNDSSALRVCRSASKTAEELQYDTKGCVAMKSQSAFAVPVFSFSSSRGTVTP